MSQDALLAALRLSAGSPGAALALFQGDNWQARETLCQALAYSVQSGDWYSLLAALNHEQAPARLHWLATLPMKMLQTIVDCSEKLALSLKTRGLINIQYLIYQGELYVIEVNPRASRTVPYISKVTGVPGWPGPPWVRR